MFEITRFKLIVGSAVVFLIIAGAIGYFFFTKSNTPTTGASPDEVTRLIDEISRIYDLPTGEPPTVATVTDVEKLKDQPFFAKAKNGDKVIIYNQAKKAILYDPISKKILEVAPINSPLGPQQATESANEESSAPGGPSPAPVKDEAGSKPSALGITAKIALRNGAGRRGLAAAAEVELKKTYPDVNVVSKDNVDGENVDKTIVVVFNDKFKADADKLKEFFKATIAPLPKGEGKIESADIMVILGRDRL